MTRKIVPIVLTALLGAALSAPPAFAASASVVANVTRVLVIGNDNFGGCMARLSVDPASVLPLCRSDWVTFSCTGHFTDPVRAYRMVDQAQLALAADLRAWVQIVDTSQHNGYCMANRIDVIK